MLLHANEIGDALQVDDGRRLPSDGAVPDHHRDSDQACHDRGRRQNMWQAPPLLRDDRSSLSGTTERIIQVHSRVADVAKAASRILLETALQQTMNVRRRGFRQPRPVRFALEDRKSVV